MSQYPAVPLDPRDHASPDPSASSSRDQPAPLPSDPTQPPHHAPTYTNPLAIGSLVSGVIGVMLTFMCVGSIGLGTRGRYAWPMTGGIAVLVAVVLGLIALSQIKAGKGSGRGLAIGGIICGILVPLLLLVVVGYVFVALGQDFENLEDFEWAPEDEPLKEDIFEDPAIKLIPLEPIDLPPLDNPAPKTPPDPTDSTPPISPPPPPSPTTSPPSN